MFENAGRKLKILAEIYFAIVFIGTLIGGIIVGCNARNGGFLLFLAISGGGALVSYISGLFIYAFGDLVENIVSIKDDAGYLRKNCANNAEKEPVNENSKNERVQESVVQTQPVPDVKTDVTGKKSVVITQADLVGETSLVCPVCKMKQLSNRTICFSCGTKFERSE